MASHSIRSDSFSSFLDTLKSVLAQTQSLFEEGPLSDNRVASLNALETVAAPGEGGARGPKLFSAPPQFLIISVETISR